MTDIEAKALALVNETRREYPNASDYSVSRIALCRAIEQHEAFKQKVSDTLQEYIECFSPPSWHRIDQFIIPKPKPDPLVEVCKGIGFGHTDIGDMAENLSIALEACGLEIREKGQ
jgi:hypothetical protein